MCPHGDGEPGQGAWVGSRGGRGVRGGVPDATSAARAPPPPGSASQPLCSLVQFDCTNTLNDQTLENVTVQMEPTEAYEVLGYVPARSLPYNQPGTCYTLVALPKEDPTAGEPPGLLGAPGSGGGRGLCTSRPSPVRASAPGGRSREEGQPALELCTQQLISSSHTLRGSTVVCPRGYPRSG